MRRKHEALPEVTISAQGEVLTLALPLGFLDQHPLMRAELEQEMQYQHQAGWHLLLK
jgi:exopolyphosphatase/guanosine-5'-triphosphate,3'-diphosphate pyrophosphatase